MLDEHVVFFTMKMTITPIFIQYFNVSFRKHKLLPITPVNVGMEKLSRKTLSRLNFVLEKTKILAISVVQTKITPQVRSINTKTWRSI